MGLKIKCCCGRKSGGGVPSYPRSSGVTWLWLALRKDTGNPEQWKSGCYLATLTAVGQSQSTSSRCLFVVRSGRPGSSSKLLQLATNTYNAYTNWGGHVSTPITIAMVCRAIVSRSIDRSLRSLKIGNSRLFDGGE